MTCQGANTQDKPVLDQATFQQLLSAAYTLQKQNDKLPVKKAGADFPQTHSDGDVAGKVHTVPLVSMTPEPLAQSLPVKSALPMAQPDVQPLASLNDSATLPATPAEFPNLSREVLAAAHFKPAPARPTQLIPAVQHPVPRATMGSRRRVVPGRLSQSNELFWRAATVVAMAGVSALLLGASIDRVSPLPASLALPSELVQQQVPFRRAKRLVTIVMEPKAKTNIGPIEQTVVPDNTTGGSAIPAAAQKTIANQNRVHSAYASEADMVARDTVVRYGPRSAAPSVQVRK